MSSLSESAGSLRADERAKPPKRVRGRNSGACWLAGLNPRNCHRSGGGVLFGNRLSCAGASRRQAVRVSEAHR
jgi:hypothetical protein